MTVQIFEEKAKAVIRSRPELAERNLRNAVRVYVPYQVQVYGQDLVDILAELDKLRAERAPVALGAGRG